MLKDLPKHVEINFTCDAWQASNVDGYFAVTGHWIEEVNGSWLLQNAILGFVQLQNTHNAQRLGGTLYWVFERVGILQRVNRYTLSITHCILITNLGWTWRNG